MSQVTHTVTIINFSLLWNWGAMMTIVWILDCTNTHTRKLPLFNYFTITLQKEWNSAYKKYFTKTTCTYIVQPTWIKSVLKTLIKKHYAVRYLSMPCCFQLRYFILQQNSKHNTIWNIQSVKNAPKKSATMTLALTWTRPVKN